MIFDPLLIELSLYFVDLITNLNLGYIYILYSKTFSLKNFIKPLILIVYNIVNFVLFAKNIIKSDRGKIFFP